MEHEIINCYQLDIRQDIPKEMELLKTSNESLKQTNQSFKIILAAIGLGFILFVVYQKSNPQRVGKENS